MKNTENTIELSSSVTGSEPMSFLYEDNWYQISAADAQFVELLQKLPVALRVKIAGISYKELIDYAEKVQKERRIEVAGLFSKKWKCADTMERLSFREAYLNEHCFGLSMKQFQLVRAIEKGLLDDKLDMIESYFKNSAIEIKCDNSIHEK